MRTRHCCQGARPNGSREPTDRDRRRPRPLTRAVEFLKWLAPGALLALLPKCPVCFAGYVALATGIGISLPTAGHLRTALALACVASLAFLLATRGRRALARLVARSRERA